MRKFSYAGDKTPREHVKECLEKMERFSRTQGDPDSRGSLQFEAAEEDCTPEQLIIALSTVDIVKYTRELLKKWSTVTLGSVRKETLYSALSTTHAFEDEVSYREMWQKIIDELDDVVIMLRTNKLGNNELVTPGMIPIEDFAKTYHARYLCSNEFQFKTTFEIAAYLYSVYFNNNMEVRTPEDAFPHDWEDNSNGAWSHLMEVLSSRQTVESMGSLTTYDKEKVLEQRSPNFIVDSAEACATVAMMYGVWAMPSLVLRVRSSCEYLKLTRKAGDVIIHIISSMYDFDGWENCEETLRTAVSARMTSKYTSLPPVPCWSEFADVCPGMNRLDILTKLIKTHIGSVGGLEVEETYGNLTYGGCAEISVIDNGGDVLIVDHSNRMTERSRCRNLPKGGVAGDLHSAVVATICLAAALVCNMMRLNWWSNLLGVMGIGAFVGVNTNAYVTLLTGAPRKYDRSVTSTFSALITTLLAVQASDNAIPGVNLTLIIALILAELASLLAVSSEWVIYKRGYLRLHPDDFIGDTGACLYTSEDSARLPLSISGVQPDSSRHLPVKGGYTWVGHIGKGMRMTALEYSQSIQKTKTFWLVGASAGDVAQRPPGYANFCDPYTLRNQEGNEIVLQWAAANLGDVLYVDKDGILRTLEEMLTGRFGWDCSLLHSKRYNVSNPEIAMKVLEAINENFNRAQRSRSGATVFPRRCTGPLYRKMYAILLEYASQFNPENGEFEDVCLATPSEHIREFQKFSPRDPLTGFYVSMLATNGSCPFHNLHCVDRAPVRTLLLRHIPWYNGEHQSRLVNAVAVVASKLSGRYREASSVVGVNFTELAKSCPEIMVSAKQTSLALEPFREKVDGQIFEDKVIFKFGELALESEPGHVISLNQPAVPFERTTVPTARYSEFSPQLALISAVLYLTILLLNNSKFDLVVRTIVAIVNYVPFTRVSCLVEIVCSRGLSYLCADNVLRSCLAVYSACFPMWGLYIGLSLTTIGLACCCRATYLEPWAPAWYNKLSGGCYAPGATRSAGLGMKAKDEKEEFWRAGRTCYHTEHDCSHSTLKDALKMEYCRAPSGKD